MLLLQLGSSNHKSPLGILVWGGGRMTPQLWNNQFSLSCKSRTAKVSSGESSTNSMGTFSWLSSDSVQLLSHSSSVGLRPNCARVCVGGVQFLFTAKLAVPQDKQGFTFHLFFFQLGKKTALLFLVGGGRKDNSSRRILALLASPLHSAHTCNLKHNVSINVVGIPLRDVTEIF